MLREGHFGISLILVSPVVFALLVLGFPVLAVLSVVATVIGGGLPDLDVRTSIVKHRGWTHTLWFAVVSSIGGSIALVTVWVAAPSIVSSRVSVVGVASVGLLFGFGVLTHIVGDVITPRGIRLFEPVLPRGRGGVSVSDRKFCLDLVNAKNSLANNGLLSVGVGVIVAVVYGAVVVVGVGAVPGL